jgi:hypothetical protein
MRSAILGSLKQRLTIRQLYDAFEEKYPYFQEAGDTWKASMSLCVPRTLFTQLGHTPSTAIRSPLSVLEPYL